MILSILTFLFIINPVSAQTSEFEIIEGSVEFVSKSTLETFEGETDQISGSFAYDFENPGNALSGSIEVDMVSLTTGKKKRDKHMHKNHLHTSEFPTSIFSAEQITKVISKDDSGIQLEISGTFDMHGVKNEIKPVINAEWIKYGEEINVTATFKVLLPDYEIPRPGFLVMKVSEEQAIEVKFKARKK